MGQASRLCTCWRVGRVHWKKKGVTGMEKVQVCGEGWVGTQPSPGNTPGMMPRMGEGLCVLVWKLALHMLGTKMLGQKFTHSFIPAFILLLCTQCPLRGLGERRDTKHLACSPCFRGSYHLAAQISMSFSKSLLASP